MGGATGHLKSWKVWVETREGRCFVGNGGEERGGERGSPVKPRGFLRRLGTPQIRPCIHTPIYPLSVHLAIFFTHLCTFYCTLNFTFNQEHFYVDVNKAKLSRAYIQLIQPTFNPLIVQDPPLAPSATYTKQGYIIYEDEEIPL